MKKVFKYDKPDRFALYMGIGWIVIAAALIYLIWFLWGDGGYVTASAIAILLAIGLLCALSIPRKIEVSDTALEIKCVVEITSIPLADLRTIRRVEKDEMKKVIPLLAGYGFFGYYGYFLDLRGWETVKVYCTQRSNYLELVDIYEKRYYINYAKADELLGSVAANALIHCPESNK